MSLLLKVEEPGCLFYKQKIVLNGSALDESTLIRGDQLM
jgi:hypothetical protein